MGKNDQGERKCNGSSENTLQQEAKTRLERKEVGLQAASEEPSPEGNPV